MSASSLADFWYRSPPDEDSTDLLVLGGLSDDDGQAWAIGSAVATSTRSLQLRDLLEACFKHIVRKQPLQTELRKGAPSAVPLADRAIGNLQQWLIGTYHGVSNPQLQVYLDEFVFRHNRRNTPAAAFQTLLGLGTSRKSTEYQDIRRAKDPKHNR